MTSVASGRCGPCASMAPTGRMATAFARSRSRTSSQVNCARSSTAMGGWIVPGRAVDRQALGARGRPWRRVAGEGVWDARLPRARALADTTAAVGVLCAMGRFTGYTRVQPKADVQTPRSLLNTPVGYAKDVIGCTGRNGTL